jgi:hypothetical protein
MYPERREDMLRASGNSKALPQLHVNDNVRSILKQGTSRTNVTHVQHTMPTHDAL